MFPLQNFARKELTDNPMSVTSSAAVVYACFFHGVIAIHCKATNALCATYIEMLIETALVNATQTVTGAVLISHYDDVIMNAIATQITSLTVVYSTVYVDADQRKHQSSASLAFVRGIHRGPVNSPHKWPVTRKMFPFDDVIMFHELYTPDNSTTNNTKQIKLPAVTCNDLQYVDAVM